MQGPRGDAWLCSTCWRDRGAARTTPCQQCHGLGGKHLEQASVGLPDNADRRSCAIRRGDSKARGLVDSVLIVRSCGTKTCASSTATACCTTGRQAHGCSSRTTCHLTPALNAPFIVRTRLSSTPTPPWAHPHGAPCDKKAPMLGIRDPRRPYLLLRDVIIGAD